MAKVATTSAPQEGKSPSVAFFRHAPVFAVAATAVVLGYRFFHFISLYSINVLVFDQWDFLTDFFEGTPTLAKLFFRQHGPHREGVGLIADKVLYPLTRWNVRVESFMIGSCIVVAMLLALVLKRRLFGRFTFSDVAIPMMFLTLVQFETMVGTPNPAYSGFPLLLIMLYALALLLENTLLRYSLVLFLNSLLIFTGFGFFMGPVTLGIFAVEGYWSLRRMNRVPLIAPIAAFLAAGASLGAFFIHYALLPAVSCFKFPIDKPVLYPEFMGLMFSEFVDFTHPLFRAHLRSAPRGGAAILLAAVAMLAIQVFGRRARAGRWDAGWIGAVLLAFSLLFSAGTAIGRVCLGPASALASRYATLLIPAFLGMYLGLLLLTWKQLRNTALSLFVLLLLSGDVLIPEWVRRVVDGKRDWVTCYLRTEDIDFCDAATKFRIYPRPEATGLKQKLQYLKERRLSFFADQVTK